MNLVRLARSRPAVIGWVLAAALVGTAGNLFGQVVFTEDFNDNDIADWTAGSINLDNPGDVLSPPSAAGGQVTLRAHASCFTDPFSGLGETLTKTINLPNGAYNLSYDVSQSTTFYAFCSTAAAGESGILVNGVPISPVSCTVSNDCGTCTVPTTTVSGCFTVTGGSAELKLQTFATDCGDSTGVFDNIIITVDNKCPFSLGYWKTHPAAWPVTTLTLGTVSYTQTQLLAILKTSPGTGTKSDASLILAYQLIAAKLNVANGSNPCLFAAAMAAADALIDGRTIPITPKITPNTAEGQQMVSLANTLAQLNTPTPGCTP